ncbi:MAG: hypothetical protein EB084_08760 [Proteobacteria bacterium]|nr:hypothetical protein [Pseudomonadota bacterium]
MFGIDVAETRMHAAVLMLVCATFVAMAARRLRMPYTVALVLMGLVLGFAPMLQDLPLSADGVLLLFLPPILFEGMLATHVERLRESWKEVTLLSLGVTFGTFVGLGGFVRWAFGWPWPVSMLVGAILASTDPVSVLALMREVGAPPRLALLLEAESCFNDGLGVVLFVVVSAWVAGQSVTLVSASTVFVREAFGGLALGAVLAALACGFLRRAADRLTEAMSTLALAYGVYIVCQGVHVSGIMGVIAAGLVVGSALPRLLSPVSQGALEEAWELFAFLANSVLFLFMGVALQHGDPWGALPSALLVFVAMTLLRAVLVVVLVGRRTPPGWPAVLTWGGVRGSIPLALALALPPLEGQPGRDAVVSVVFGVVFVSLLGQGFTVGPLMRLTGVTGEATGAAPGDQACAPAVAVSAGESARSSSDS